MLKLIVKGQELWDNQKEEFTTSHPEVVLELEHSLISLSKWESKFNKPFLSGGLETREETFEYIKFMILTPDYSPEVFSRFTQENIDEINAYIDSPQSATTFGEMPEKKVKGETVTSELIYYWIDAFGIDWQAQYWHLNRLFSLIKIHNIKNSKPKKMSRQEAAEYYRELNKKRRAETGSKG